MSSKHARKALCAAALFIAALLAPSYGDEFEEFKALFEKLAASMDDAASVPSDSPIAIEYERELSRLDLKARLIQSGIVRLKVPDINLPKTVSMLPEIYSIVRKRCIDDKLAAEHDSVKNVKVTGVSQYYKKLYDPKGRPIDYDCREDLIAIIREEIELLDSMNFKMEDASCMSVDQRSQSLASEYERLLNNYTRNIMLIATAARGSIWRERFEKSLLKMKALSVEMHQWLIGQDFKLALSLNLPGNTSALKEIYDSLPKMDLTYERPSSQKATKLQTGSKRSIETVEKESCYVADKIATAVFKIKRLEAMSPPASDVPEQPAAGETSRPPSSPLAAPAQYLESQKMWDEIISARESIWSADPEMVGCGQETIKQYLATMTKAEKASFAALSKLYQDKLHEKSVAESSALREMHMRGALPPSGNGFDELSQIAKATKQAAPQAAADKKPAGN